MSPAGVMYEPQIKLPISNTKTLARNVHLRLKCLKALPHGDWKTPRVMKKAEAYQPMSANDYNVGQWDFCEMSRGKTHLEVIGDAGDGGRDDCLKRAR